MPLRITTAASLSTPGKNASSPLAGAGQVWRGLDAALLFSVLALLGVGLVAIHAATWNRAGGNATLLRQGFYDVVGLVLLAVVAARDYRQIPRWASLLYGAMLLLLLIVLFAAPNTRGAARWIHLPIPGMDFKLQPSEFAKVGIILTLSNYVAHLGARIREPVALAKTLVHVGVPMLLIMKQPDLGTSLVFLAIWFGIVFLAGAKWQHLLLLVIAGVALFAFAWRTNVLHKFQKDRVRTFVNPLSDPQGKGYHVLQAETAIGGGGISGQGWKRGTQTTGHFIPENHTDFVFTVIGEEAGFVGACALLGLYGLLLYRGVRTIAACEDSAGRLIAGGVVTLFTFHLVVNIGMTCGIMPVVGVPLPLVSFGGSSAWANLAAVGLLLGVHRNRPRFHF